MNPEEDQFCRHLEVNPEDWQTRLALLERLAARGDGDAVVAWIAQAPNAPATENGMRRVVELANGIGQELEALKHVLGLFLKEHIASSWAHYTLAQVLYYTHDTVGALQHYRTSKSLNPARSIPELDSLIRGEAPGGDDERSETGEGETLARIDVAGDALPFLVSEFDLVQIKAAEREDDTRKVISAFSVAVGFHVLLCLYFAFFLAVGGRPGVPTFLARLPERISDPANPPDAKKYDPSQHDTMSEDLAFKHVEMAMKAPEPPGKPANPFDPVGGIFGAGMSFSPDAAGSAVSFFGTKARGNRVVFVVDFSTSMYGDRDALMRNELRKSLIGLPKDVEYALIFFAGPAWFAGQIPPVDSSRLAEGIGMEIRDGDRTHIWYEGWSEEERHFGERRTALFHYADGEANLPRGSYVRATEENIRKSLEQLRATPLVYGTDWRWPLKMAMTMQPDTIYFMTDGVFEVGRGVAKAQMIEELLAFNRENGRARINTVCMKVLMARAELEQLSKSTGGKFTLVREDGTIVSGAALGKEF